MGTLEDQLKKWKHQQPTTDKKPPSTSTTKPAAPARDDPARRPSTKKEPYPAYTLRRDEPVAVRQPTREAPKPPEPPATDAELFARAVQNVERDVVLQKFDAGGAASTSSKGGRGAPVAPPPSDEDLFLSFVGGARPTTSSTRSSSARAELAPHARLSLKGTTTDVASRRLRAFLDDAVRAGAGSVIVDVDDGSDAALDVARAHAAVLSVRDAPPAHGGKGARVVRFKT
jgi:hypothetical protein